MNFLRVFLFAMMFAMAFAQDLNRCDPRHDDFHQAFLECDSACQEQPGCVLGYCANDHTFGREFECKCAGSSLCNPFLDHIDE